MSRLRVQSGLDPIATVEFASTTAFLALLPMALNIHMVFPGPIARPETLHTPLLLQIEQRCKQPLEEVTKLNAWGAGINDVRQQAWTP